MFEIKEGMSWPPKDIHTMKMKEHAAWYAGEPELLADFYYANELSTMLPTTYHLTNKKNSFWGRMIKNDIDFCLHIPIASDIAETSASFLFGEKPVVRINKEVGKNQVTNQNKPIDDAQTFLDDMLNKTGFYQKILEGAETASAIGGVYIKIANDSDVCEYPIPLIVQEDCAFGEFKYGFLTKAVFPFEYVKGDKYYRLFEIYEKGKVSNELYAGSSDNLGKKVPLTTIDETKDMKESVNTGVDDILARYIPNILPNRLDRTSKLGRSDLQGLESMMDSLDEAFSNWMREVQLAKGKVHVPEDYLKENTDGKQSFNIDKDVYVKLDVDPTNTAAGAIVVSQFIIHANELEKTVLNLLDRIITSAGYSPQSFGLNIQGRAESGTALDIRERKSFATTNKKQAYWHQPLRDTIKNMCSLYKANGGKIDTNIDIDIKFADGITNNIQMIANSVKLMFDAQAVSTKVKVEMLHPDWTESQVEAEVQLILSEGKSSTMAPPDGFENQDITQMKDKASNDLGENNNNDVTTV